ncbi:MAG: C4-dicarboxylate ABC transporter, partial [Methylococcales bacterium]|nr:C4-dicarboxylate ABC transporter [Methylococcales bacterium]
HVRINGQRLEIRLSEAHFSPRQSHFQGVIHGLGGTHSFSARYTGQHWQLNVQLNGLTLALLSPLLPPEVAAFSGHVQTRLTLTGNADGIEQLSVNDLKLTLSADHQQGQWALAEAQFSGAFSAKHLQSHWHWQGWLRLDAGALYAQPVYLEVDSEPLTLWAKGRWHRPLLAIDAFAFEHPGAAHVTGFAELTLGKTIGWREGLIRLDTSHLSALGQHYLAPWLGTNWPLQFSGSGSADLVWRQGTPEKLTLALDQVNIDDRKGRVQAQALTARIHWQRQQTPAPSWLAWQELNLFTIPLAEARLQFMLEGPQLTLAEPARLPLLGGALSVEDFYWRGTDDEPEVGFQGALRDIDLTALSQALNWPSFSGRLSGRIPGVRYHNRVLRLQGELTAQLFDGQVRLNNLSSSGLFRDFWRLEADLDLEAIDLARLTQEFDLGRIEGRLSGFVHDLVLENGQPSGFFAWLGTPDDDDSPHRISQRAVNALASIGGGGATDTVSRALLRFLDTFGYEKLGLGCYLYQGVCQLSGVAPAGDGYYIVKGGGLPRIDVMGYNLRMDWPVLWQRLQRLFTAESAVVQ